MVLQQINGKRQHQRKALYPALAESVLEGMLNEGVPAPLARICRLMGARRADRSLVRRQFRLQNRLFRVDAGKGGVHLRAIELPLPD